MNPTQLIAGKYELHQMIGRGGMGSVWEGRHVTLGTRVAIKFIESEFSASDEARSRFETEARAAATIQSKYAIQIYDHGVSEDGRPYIVMEYLQGEPLDKRLDRTGRLSLPETARIIQQVSKALGRAHERGIVHRDLKPENIFLVRDDEEGGEIAKVLDFGIAKIRTNDLSSVSSNTKTGAVLGTPYYMSPEQARGLRSVDHRSDIWSLGVIAFRCVSGRLPFDGESVGDLLVKICIAPLPVPSTLVQGLPTMFDSWFAKCLEREPAARFNTAQELSEALAETAGITIRRSNVSGNLKPVGSQASGQAYPTPSPLSGTPLPQANATSTGLSSSTAGLFQPPKNRGGGALALVAIGLTVMGLGGGTVAYLGWIKKDSKPTASAATTGTTQVSAQSTAEPKDSAAPTVANPLEILRAPTATATASSRPLRQSAGGVPNRLTTKPPASSAPPATAVPHVAPAKTSSPGIGI